MTRAMYARSTSARRMKQLATLELSQALTTSRKGGAQHSSITTAIVIARAAYFTSKDGPDAAPSAREPGDEA